MLKQITKGMVQGLLITVLVSGASQAHVIWLRRGRELVSLNKPEYHEKTGYFRYVAEDERDAMIRAEDVLHIVEMEE